MAKVSFPIDLIDKENSPERELILRYLSSSQKLDASEVNLFRDAINELYNSILKAGLDRRKAEILTKPVPTGFYRYSVSTPGVYVYFLDINSNAIEVTTEDMSKGFVEIWVNDGVAEKVIQYINISDQVNDGINDIIGTDSLALFIDSSQGDTIAADDMQTTLTATVERYFKDFTPQVVSWQWFRESGDTQEDRDSDAIWAQDKTSRIIHLTNEDFTANIYNRSVTFTCQAIVNNEIIEAKTTIG